MNKLFKKLSLGLVLQSLWLSAYAQVPTVQQEPQQATQQVDQQPASEILLAKLAPLDSFSANFIQKVFDNEGQLLQSATGSLASQKPNLVRWHTNEPAETLIVSDGKTLWFFDPFIEQVSAYQLENAIANTPILLLTSNDPQLWEKFTISSSDGENFLITAKDVNAQVKSLTLSFNGDLLQGFDILDSTGQLSNITITDLNNKPEHASTAFAFKIPEGVYLDDQR